MAGSTARLRPNLPQFSFLGSIRKLFRENNRRNREKEGSQDLTRNIRLSVIEEQSETSIASYSPKQQYSDSESAIGRMVAMSVKGCSRCVYVITNKGV